MFEVDAETYRYFFSASAQVFAAILVIVAIAFSIRIGDIGRELSNLSKKKIRICLSSLQGIRHEEKKLFFKDVLGVKIESSITDYDLLFDDQILEELLQKILEINDKNEENINVPGYYKLMNIPAGKIESIRNVMVEEETFRSLIAKSKKNVRVSTYLAAIMTSYSLFMFALKSFNHFSVILSSIAFITVIGIITYLFVKTFD